MKTKSEQERDGSISNKIKAKILLIIPDFQTGERDRTGHLKDSLISITVNAPYPYMGRFGPGREHWTILVKESVRYSRTRVIRVRVQGSLIWFDEQKLVAHVEACRQIVKEYEASMAKIRAAEEELPKLPLGMEAEPLPDGRYRILIGRTGGISQVKEIAKVVAGWNRIDERNKHRKLKP